MHIEMLSITDIRPYENNPRQNDAAVDAIAASIKQFGFYQPIVIDAEGLIVCGHTRSDAFGPTRANMASRAPPTDRGSFLRPATASRFPAIVRDGYTFPPAEEALICKDLRIIRHFDLFYSPSSPDGHFLRKNRKHT